MDNKLVYLEFKEESYGHGLAHLEEIDPLSLPPSREAIDIFHLLLASFNGKGWDDSGSRKIVSELALFGKPQIIRGLDELFKHKVITNGNKAQSYRINKNYLVQCNKDYLEGLK